MPATSSMMSRLRRRGDDASATKRPSSRTTVAGDYPAQTGAGQLSKCAEDEYAYSSMPQLPMFVDVSRNSSSLGLPSQARHRGGRDPPATAGRSSGGKASSMEDRVKKYMHGPSILIKEDAAATASSRDPIRMRKQVRQDQPVEKEFKLPAISKNNTQVVREKKRVIIRASGDTVSFADLMRLRRQFDDMSAKGGGEVSFEQIMASSGKGGQAAISGKVLASKSGTKIRKRQTWFDRCDRGVFNFKDMLRFTYPAASPAEIDEMDDTCITLGKWRQDKTRLEQFSVQDRQSAELAYLEVDPDDTGEVMLSDFEDYLLVLHSGNVDLHHVLSHLDRDVRDRLYDGDGLDKGEFMMVFLKLMDFLPAVPRANNKLGRRF